MKKLVAVICLVGCLGSITFAQAEEKKGKKDRHQTEISIDREVKEAMKAVEEALANIEIPDIDIDAIMEEVEEAMPTHEELESYRDVIVDAMEDLQDIDLSPIEEALEELAEMFEDIEIDIKHDRDKDRKKDEE